MLPDAFVKGQIVAFAHAEAAHTGSLNSMLAVCYILRNRVRAGWHGGDWMSVLNHAEDASAYQFSNRREQFNLSNNVFRRLLMEIDDIYQGVSTDNMTEGGLYYIDCLPLPHFQHRPWFITKIVRDRINHPRVAQVGMIHIFR